LADNIAQGVTLNDLSWLKSLLPRIAAVTPADVQRVAKKYLDPNQRVVVWSVPKESADEDVSKGGSAKKPEEEKRSDSHSPPASRPQRRDDKFQARLAANLADKPTTETTVGAAAAPGEFSLLPAKRIELPNGLVLLLWENHRLPIVVAEAHVNDVSLREPAAKAGVASLMGELLDEGTAKQTSEQIAETIEDVGGILSLGSSGGSVKVLSNNRSLGLGLLLECLHEPNFPAEAFDREREHQLAAIDDAQRQPMERGLMAFRRLVYGHHPFGRPALGTHKSVEKLKPADCAAFHDQLFVPNNMQLAIAGDINPDEVIAEIKKLTADWKKGELPELSLAKLEPQTEFVQKIITMPDAVQLQFFMGHLGIRRENPDYYKLLVMDYVLGTGPGFTDRLSSRLRDREGLAYTVSANITSSAGEEPGLFTCYIGTEAKNFTKVKEQFIEELNRIRSEAPKPDEVSDVQKYLLGQLPFEFTTNAQIAGRLLTVARYHLGFDYLADFRRAISAVTTADILAMAKKHLDPEHMVLVAAGAIDDHGKPLAKAAPPKEKPAEEDQKK
jgi:zinc protease